MLARQWLFSFGKQKANIDTGRDLWRVAQIETYLEAPFLFAQLNIVVLYFK